MSIPARMPPVNALKDLARVYEESDDAPGFATAHRMWRIARAALQRLGVDAPAVEAFDFGAPLECGLDESGVDLSDAAAG